MIHSDTFHTVDVFPIRDLLSHNDTDYVNDSYYDSSYTEETLEEFLYTTYKSFGESVLCRVFHRKSCVYEDDMTVYEFTEDISHETYYVDSQVVRKVM